MLRLVCELELELEWRWVPSGWSILGSPAPVPVPLPSLGEEKEAVGSLNDGEPGFLFATAGYSSFDDCVSLWNFEFWLDSVITKLYFSSTKYRLDCVHKKLRYKQS